MADVYIESLLNGGFAENPTTSLDRQELNALLHAVDSKTDTLEHLLFDTVKTSSDVFLSSWNSSQSTKASVQILLQDLDALQREVYNDENGIQMVVKSSLSEYNDIVDKVASNQNMIDSLELLTPIVDQLKLVESQLTSGYLTETRRLLEELDTNVAERFKGVHWNRLNAIHVIRNRITIIRERLLEALQVCITRNIIIQSPSDQSGNKHVEMKVNYRFNSIPQTSSGVSITLSEVFTCISELGSLEAYMAPIKKSISGHVIASLLGRTDQAWSVNVEEEGDESASLKLISTGARNVNGDDQEFDPCRTIHDVDTVFDFFYKYLFGQSVQPKGQNLLFGNLIIPGAFELLISNTLRPYVPSTIPKLNSYIHVANSVQALEDKLLSYNFMADKENASLTRFVDNIDRYFSLKLKEKILVNARKVMLRKIYDAEPVNDPLNESRHYFVTQTPRLLLVLIQDTIDTAQQIAEEHPTSSVELWHAISELVDLYRALMPTYHGESYSNDYSIAMLFRNDCYWLASHLTKLQNTHSSDSIPLEIAAQKLRQLGGVWYEITVGRIVSQINHTLDRIDGFLNISQDSRMADRAGQAVTDSVDLVLRFSAVVQGVLDDDLFLQTIAYVSDTIVSRLISEIEAMHDIGEQESHLIARCLNGIMSLIDAFSRPGRPDATDPFVAQHVKDWNKFWIVRNMLEMSFRDIMQQFHDGQLQCFQTNELCDLICALFADTELRQNNLREIRQGYQPQWQQRNSYAKLQPIIHSQEEESLWEPFDESKTEDQSQEEGWEPFDDPQTEIQPQQEGWEPFDDDIHIEDQPREEVSNDMPQLYEPASQVDVAMAEDMGEPQTENQPEEDESLWEPLEDSHPHDALKEVEEGWEAFDDPSAAEQHEAEGWEPFDDHIMPDAPKLEPSHQPLSSPQHPSESSLTSMRNNLNRNASTPKSQSDYEEPYKSRSQSSPPEQQTQEDSFASLFSGITRATPSPHPEHRSGSPQQENTFSSLLGNIIGATPSPNLEQQAAKQSSSGLALPSFDAFGYASNRIAGEFTNVVGNMIGASHRTTQSPDPADVSPSGVQSGYWRSKSPTKPAKEPSKFDLAPQNLDDEPAGEDEEEGGWDW